MAAVTYGCYFFFINKYDAFMGGRLKSLYATADPSCGRKRNARTRAAAEKVLKESPGISAQLPSGIES